MQTMTPWRSEARSASSSAGPSITAIVDRRDTAPQTAEALVMRLGRFGSVRRLCLVVHHGASPMAYGFSGDQYTMLDLPPTAWIEMHEASLRTDHERLAGLAEPLVEAGYSPIIEQVGGSVRQSLRCVPKRWPADVVLVASPARWLPMRTSGTPVEQLPLLRGRRTVVSALSWY